MNPTEQLEKQLKDLEADLHKRGATHIKFNQQRVKKGNMSFTGGNGRLCVGSVAGCFDISLSGKDLTAEMSSKMEMLCGRSCDGYHQTNQKSGKQDQPYWRVNHFPQVQDALDLYAGTKKLPA